MRDESYLKALHIELVKLIRAGSSQGITDFDLYDKLRMNATFAEMREMLGRIVDEGIAVSEDMQSCAGLWGATYIYQMSAHRAARVPKPEPARVQWAGSTVRIVPAEPEPASVPSSWSFH